jgi:hypothetical protein
MDEVTEISKLRIMESAAGHYIGRTYNGGFPYERITGYMTLARAYEWLEYYHRNDPEDIDLSAPHLPPSLRNPQ